jgi:hypothetical protein
MVLGGAAGSAGGGVLAGMHERSKARAAVKQAAESSKGFSLSDLGSTAMNVGTGAMQAGQLGVKGLMLGAVGGPLALGGIAGAADAALNAPTPEDIEDLRKAEMIGLLNRMSGEIRTRAQHKIASETVRPEVGSRGARAGILEGASKQLEKQTTRATELVRRMKALRLQHSLR